MILSPLVYRNSDNSLLEPPDTTRTLKFVTRMTPQFQPLRLLKKQSAGDSANVDDELYKRYKELKYKRLLRKELADKTVNEKVFSSLNREILDILLDRRIPESRRVQLYLNAVKRYLLYRDKVQLDRLKIKPVMNEVANVTEKALETVSKEDSKPVFKTEDSDDDVAGDNNDKSFDNQNDLFDDNSVSDERGADGGELYSSGDELANILTPERLDRIRNQLDTSRKDRDDDIFGSDSDEESPSYRDTSSRLSTTEEIEALNRPFVYGEPVSQELTERTVEPTPLFHITTTATTKRQITPKKIFQTLPPKQKEAGATYF